MGPETATRPRIGGERECEILQAAREALTEVGYDRLTMDAVAHRAKASKATLYRRWSGKAALVIDALMAEKEEHAAPVDTGTLRGDLLAAYCGFAGLTDPKTVSRLAAIITAISVDEEFAVAFRERVLGPKNKTSQAIFERARARGELREDVDLDLIGPALAGIVLHRVFMYGEVPDQNTVTRVVDQIILPAALNPAREPAREKESRVH